VKVAVGRGQMEWRPSVVIALEKVLSFDLQLFDGGHISLRAVLNDLLGGQIFLRQKHFLDEIEILLEPIWWLIQLSLHIFHCFLLNGLDIVTFSDQIAEFRH